MFNEIDKNIERSPIIETSIVFLNINGTSLENTCVLYHLAAICIEKICFSKTYVNRINGVGPLS